MDATWQNYHLWQSLGSELRIDSGVSHIRYQRLHGVEVSFQKLGVVVCHML